MRIELIRAEAICFLPSDSIWSPNGEISRCSFFTPIAEAKKEESRRTRIKQVLWCHATLLHRWTGIVIHSMRHMVPISSHLRSGRDGSCRCHAGDPMETMKLRTRETSANLWGSKCKWYRWVYRILNVLSIYIDMYHPISVYTLLFFYNLNTETYYIYA